MRHTAPTIEQATDLAYRNPGHSIRVRDTWSAECSTDLRFTLRHYGTEVLTVSDDPATGRLLVALGERAWGSVSDQGGVNRVLRHLGLTYRASRANGGWRLI